MLSVREYGQSGRYVVLLHGGPGAPGYMAPVARALADSYRVLEPFQRGSERGPASEPSRRHADRQPLSVARHIEDLHELLSAFPPDPPPVLLGSSWGAMLALAYAAAHPTSVGPLILVGCGTFDEASRAAMHATIQQRTSEAIRGSLERASRIDDPDERLEAVVEAEMPIYSYGVTGPLELDSVDARAFEETWDDMLSRQRDGTYPAAFTAIRVPVLMVHGDFDPHPGGLIRASLQPHLPQLQYVELEKCGHYPWLEPGASMQFLSVIRMWLRQHLAI